MNKIMKIVDISAHLIMILASILALIFTTYNSWILTTLIWVGISLLKALTVAKLEDKIEEITKF
jgi:predicted membrane channel-forming protein YqfA (hemolysin III family)